MKKFAVAVFVIAGAACAYAEETTLEIEYDSKNINVIQFSGVSSEAVFEPSTGPVRLAVTKYDDEKCQLEIGQNGGKLKITLKQKKSLAFWKNVNCEADVSILCPEKTELDIKTVSGEISAHGFNAPVSAGTVSGEINLNSINGPVEAGTVSGEIKISSISGLASVNTVSGDAAVEWAKAPEKGEISCDTVSGSARLVFPKGTRANFKCHSVSGDCFGSIDYGENLVINADSVSGDITAEMKK